MLRLAVAVVVTLAGFALAALPAAAQGQCPDNFVSFRGTTDPLACTCSADAAAAGFAYGMDFYADDSSICRAALHAGVIPSKGGSVVVLPAPGQRAYAGVTRNGVSSSNWGAMDGSFTFGAATEPAPAAQVPVIAPSPATAPQCPDNFVAFRGTSAPLTCGCPPEAIAVGFAYGMDIYTDDSGICQSALHAGYISPKGGDVTVVPMPGQRRYAGVTRNGISSSNWGTMDGSFTFAAVQPKVAAASPGVAAEAPTGPVQAPVAETLAATGAVDLYIHFAFNSAELYEESFPVLQELLAVIAGDPGLRLSIVGHTDSIGGASYNLALSADRAKAVTQWLVEHGVPQNRLQASGKGESEPIDDNETEYGRAVNRRVQALRAP